MASAKSKSVDLENIQKEKEEERLQLLSQFGEARFENALIHYLEEGERRKGYHVSNTVQACHRYGYLQQKEGDTDNEVQRYNQKKVLNFAVGKKLHEVELSSLHEYEITSFDGKEFTGTCDEIYQRDVLTPVLGEDDAWVLIQDKKTKTYIPKTVDPQYQKQVERYAAMLIASKPELESARFFGQILYINVNDKAVKAFTFEIDVKKELEDLRKILAEFDEADTTGKLPPAFYHWLCTYGPCPYYAACRSYDAQDPNWKKYLPSGLKL